MISLGDRQDLGFGELKQGGGITGKGTGLDSGPATDSLDDSGKFFFPLG